MEKSELATRTEGSVLDRVLVPLDGSELSERILARVSQLTKGRRGEVTLLRALPAGTARERPAVLEGVQTDLGAHVARLREGGIDARSVVVFGDPAAAIRDHATESRATLIAMTTHARQGLQHLFLGSVAESVLRKAEAPILVANPGAPDRGRPRRILVLLDGSEKSAQILPVAAALARDCGASLILHTVVALPSVEPLVRPLLLSTEDAQQMLEEYATRVRDVPVTLSAEIGDPVPTILERARSSDADLIALTTHGRSGLSRWAFGSVAEKLVRLAPCPLLVKRSTLGEDA